MSDGTELGNVMESLGSMVGAMTQTTRFQSACYAAAEILAAQIRDRHYIADDDVKEATRCGLMIVDEVARLCIESSRIRAAAPEQTSESSDPPITPEEIERMSRESEKK